MASAPRPDQDDDTLQFATATPGRTAPSPGDTQALPTVPAAPREDDSLGGLMPMLDDPRRRFDTVMRGYDRHQVDGYVAKLEDDNRLMSSTRSENSTRAADLAAQLASAQAEIESLRRRVTAASDQINPDNVDVRVQDLVAAAQALARQTRHDADADAVRIRESATAAADALKSESQAEADHVLAAAHQRLSEADQTYSHKVAEADRHATEVSARAGEELRLAREEITAQRSTAAQEVALLRSTAANEVATARKTSAEEIAAADTAASAARTEAERQSRESRESADAAASRKRTTAEEDFEITLRLRRRKEEDEDRERRTAALREASTIVSDANNTADRIVRAARGEVERLDQERHRVHAELGVIVGRVTGIVADHDPVDRPLATN